MSKKIETVKQDPASIVEEIARELLRLMGSGADLEVKEDSVNDAILVDIKTEKESGLLIGSRGETLLALQTVISMIYKSKTGEWVRVLINVADWREKQNEKLNHLAVTSAQRAAETGEDVPLFNLSPAQRRIVHMALVDNKEVETESVGEGQDRHLVIHPKR
ncbi:KH domain-containing protein [Candidatus Woesebacteria bacterium]|nr:MAG: KH domain-containing protein [Candidatus Woesebacteria bacterium]